jgi:hypothetical protein
MNDAALALELRRLSDLVAELTEDHQHLQRRQLAADDRHVGTVLLPLAVELTGGQRFSGPALYAQALNDRTPTGHALREVLADYGSLKSLGKLFARLDGVVLVGCRLVPAGRLGDDRAWRIERVSDG